jgi:O-succinylbenzoic acid--CoA ligase
MGMMIPNWLTQRASLTPSRIAMHSDNDVLTFEELNAIVQRYAKKLTSLNVKKGVFVGVLMTNSPDMGYLIYALQQLGAITVLLNPKLTEKELTFQIHDADISVLVYSEKLTNQLPNAGSFVCIEVEDLLNLEEIEYEVVSEWDLDDVCSIMYTSGTTGRPKGVMQSYGNHWWSATGSALNLGIHESDSWICAVPLFHISGYSILMKSLIYGMSIRLYNTFNESVINQDLIKGRATHVSVVSTMLQKMVETLGEERYDASFRCMLLGGGPAPLPLLNTCTAKNIPVFQTYGMTETSSQIVTLPPEYSFSKLGSAGKPLFPAQIKIVSENHTVGSLVHGEIVVKGPNVTAGYYNREEANEKSFRDEWLHTGDQGYLDEDGFLYVLDRRSDLIISGGENVYPAEIESVLLGYEGVKEVGVIGVEDEIWGQVPIAFIVCESKLDEENILSFCEEQLAKYKIPKKFIRIDALPRNASNKLLRRKLKEVQLQVIKEEKSK